MADYRSPVYKAPPRKPVPGNAGFQFHTLDSSSSPHLTEGPSHLQASSVSSIARPPSTQYRPRTASSSFLPAEMLPARESIVGFPQPQSQQSQQYYYHHQQHQQHQQQRPHPHPQQQQQQQQQYSQRQYHHHQAAPQSPQQQPQQQQPQNQQQQQFYQYPQQQKYPQHQLQSQYGAAPPSRRASNATTCTTSTGGGNAPPARQMSQMSQVSFDTRFSTISQRPQVSYVALMRKQKATVWCDRAQTEDPRLLAQRRAAKQRALLEVHGGSSTRSSTLISAGKIRHSGNGRSISYNTSTMVGAGVPLRLSANEVGDADDEDDRIDASQLVHRRTGSSRSSTASNRISIAHQRAGQTRLSSSSSANNTPPNADIPDIIETPAAPLENIKDEDFLKTPNRSSTNTSDQRPTTSHSEEEDEFGKITEMAAPTGISTAMQKRKISDDLKRRGSVDERTSSMTGVRLFVANPDLSD
ncbi:hypothetical protein MGYG_04258 [Nannizzia gypsea CBS 118893]|uniref:Uncharacterized protein n=1 Tax=Arthroderma gypseum (strain ATCC MYA-4604 / CBS 118893) TaxID=535722 RepID=E4URZ6_ARTGP|nr:hypothetical protein MGYG_04258 [Nannizzia gypsea CBS 118893]EFR01253.1 hypothetical protein MGYG_04258 [Nannizzia gypsea CBS 118893]